MNLSTDALPRRAGAGPGLVDSVTDRNWAAPALVADSCFPGLDGPRLVGQHWHGDRHGATGHSARIAKRPP